MYLRATRRRWCAGDPRGTPRSLAVALRELFRVFSPPGRPSSKVSSAVQRRTLLVRTGPGGF